MKFKKPGAWTFTDAELAWLADAALTNYLAADILVRWSKRHGKWHTLPSRVKIFLSRPQQAAS